MHEPDRLSRVNTALNVIILSFVGGTIPTKSLLTFKLLVWVSEPQFVIMFILGTWRYHTLGTVMDLALGGACVLLLLTMTAYWP